MKKVKYMLEFILLFLLTSTMIVGAAPKLDNVHYFVIGSESNIQSLNLKLDYEINNRHSFLLLGNYDGDDFNLEGTWDIVFKEERPYNLSFGITLASNFGFTGIGKALGLSGEGVYLNQNKYFWDLKYFIDEKDNNWIYKGEIALPIILNSYLTLGLSNSYWNQDQLSLNIGVKVDL